MAKLDDVVQAVNGLAVEVGRNTQATIDLKERLYSKDGGGDIPEMKRQVEEACDKVIELETTQDNCPARRAYTNRNSKLNKKKAAGIGGIMAIILAIIEGLRAWFSS